jgi:hypothetical protein
VGLVDPPGQALLGDLAGGAERGRGGPADAHQTHTRREFHDAAVDVDLLGGKPVVDLLAVHVADLGVDGGVDGAHGLDDPLSLGPIAAYGQIAGDDDPGGPGDVRDADQIGHLPVDVADGDEVASRPVHACLRALRARKMPRTPRIFSSSSRKNTFSMKP